MAITAELFDGTLLEFPVGTPQEVIDRVAREETLKRRPAPAPVAPSTERTGKEAVTDVGASMVGGLGSLLQVPGQLAQLIPGLKGAGEYLTKPGAALEELGESLKSEGLKVREQLRNEAISEAEKEGILSSFATAITETVKDPALLSTFITGQLPQLLGPAAAAKVAKGVVAAKSGLQGEALAAATGKAGTRAAIGAGAAMQGADISADTYEQAFAAAKAQGLSDEQANDAALTAARKAFAISAPISIATQKAIPGGAAIERRLAGVPGAGRIKSALGEATQEALEEGGGAFATNVGVLGVDPTRSLTQGVGSAAGLGVIGGGVLGGALGKAAPPEVAPGGVPGETERQTVERLQAEILTLKQQAAEMDRQAAPKPEPAKPEVFGTKELFDVISKPNGYGMVEQYKQRLMNLPQTPEVEAAIQEARDVQAQFVEDSVKRMPTTAVLTEERLKDLGFQPKDPVYGFLLNKDIASPDQAEEITKKLNEVKSQEGIKPTEAAKIDNFLVNLTNLQDAIRPQAPVEGEKDAGKAVAPPSGEGVPVAGKPAEDTTAPGLGETKPDGVVPPKADVGQPTAGEAGKPVAVTPPVEAAPTPEAAAPVEQPAEPPEAPVAAKPAAPKKKSKFPSVTDIPEVTWGGPRVVPTAIAPEKYLYREVNTNDLDQLLYVDEEYIREAFFVSDNKDIATKYSKEYDKGVIIGFRPSSLSGKEQVISDAGDLAGKGYETDVIAPRAIASVEIDEKNIKELSFKTKNLLQNFDRKDLGNGRVLFTRKGLEPSKKSLADIPPERWGELERRAKAAREAPVETAEAAPAPAPEIKPVEVAPERVQLDEQIQEKLGQLEKALTRILGRFGLRDVALEIVGDLKNANAAYSSNLILLALDAPNPIRNLRHESVHALKQLNFFSDNQWKVLEKTAKEKWIQKYLKDVNVNMEPLSDGEQSRYDAYRDLFKNQGLSDAASDAAILEEAIADAFGEFDVKPPVGMMRSILNRMTNLFQGIKNAFNSLGFQTGEDIFRRVEKGELREGIVIPAPEAPKPSLRQIKDIPEFLYHATYRPLIKSINNNGLGATKITNWEDSKPGVVYLATSPDVAESYAEVSENVNENWLNQIVVLKINTRNLNKNKFYLDRNVIDNDGSAIEYHGIIPTREIFTESASQAAPKPSLRILEGKEKPREGGPFGVTIAPATTGRTKLKEKIDEQLEPEEPTLRPSARGAEGKRSIAGRPEPSGDRGGREEGRVIAPLAGAPTVQGATGPDPRLVDVAKRYAEKAGIPYRRQAKYVEVDEDRARRIAQAYEEMSHAPQDPKVREAYKDLIQQTRDQYDALMDAGYEFTFFDSQSDPYDGNPWNAMRDLRENKRMSVYGTYDGFGTEGLTDSAVENNPLLEDTGLRWKDQQGVERIVTANDLFRAVHDAFGHGLEGAGFRARGEENAWQAHARLFKGPALGAITSETRGQNSWLNYGPYGEKNRTAKVEDTVFAEQKTGLMPEWTWQEGLTEDEAPTEITLGTKQPGASSFEGFHYGNVRTDTLSGSKYGTGLRGAERRRLDQSYDPRIKRRAYFYIQKDDGTMPRPESGVGGFVYTQKFANILGPGPEMSRLFREAFSDANNFESAVIDAGYDGYAVPNMGMMVVLNHDVPVKYIGKSAEVDLNSYGKAVKASLRGEKEGIPSIGPKIDGKYLERIENIRRQIGDEYVDGKISFDEFQKRYAETNDEYVKALGVQRRLEEARPAEKLEEVFPGFVSIPVGTRILATPRTISGLPDPSPATVVDSFDIRVGAKAFRLPIVEFADGKRRKLTSGDIKDVFVPRVVKSSLRSNIPVDIRQRIVQTTVARKEEGFVQRITEAIAPESFSTLRSAFINRYNQLGVYDRRLAQKMGGKALLADVSAESAALLSDLGAGLTASVLGVHDRQGGIPVYKNGITIVSNQNNSIKGPVAIFYPLAKNPGDYQAYQYWAAVKRGSRFLANGTEQVFEAPDIAKAERLRKQYKKDFNIDFEKIQEEWIKFNDGLVEYMVDTGVLSRERADLYRKHSDYLPFYRQMNGYETVGPKVFQAISGVKPPKKLKGSEAPLDDFLENIVRNVQSSIQAGVKNVAAQRAANVAVKIDMAEKLNYKSSAPNVFHVYENGKEVSYVSQDMLFINAVKSLGIPDIPFIGFFSKPAEWLRNFVTKDPAFMLANLTRDSMSAWATSGVKMTPLVDTFANFGSALTGKSPEFQKLLNAGIIGGYEFSQNVEQSGREFAKALRKQAKVRAPGMKGVLEFGAKPITSLWEALEKGTTASDAATRMEVYKKTLAETGNEAEALFRALEVMNFNRKGSSAIVRFLTAAVPFLNARIQGLDVLYRAASGNMNKMDAKTIQRNFWARGATIAAISIAYWALTHDDDEYKKQEQETRDNYWLLPSLGIKIPIPFEVGVMFKVIPERIAGYLFGSDTGEDFIRSMARQLVNTLAFNPIPQVGLPILESVTNYSLFTMRPIVGQGLEGVQPAYQVGPGTSRLSEMVGAATKGMAKEFQISPTKLDNLISGYTGTMGMYLVSLFDAIYDMNTDSPKPARRFEQMPFIRRFAVDPEARGTVTAYYDLKNSVDSIVRTSNMLERTMNYEELPKYLQDNAVMLASKDYLLDLEKTLKEFREMKVIIRSAEMDAKSKGEAVSTIEQMENALTGNIQYLKKIAKA